MKPTLLDEVLHPYPDGGPLLDRLRWWQERVEDERLMADMEEICTLLTIAPRSAGDISREHKFDASAIAYAEAQRPYVPTLKDTETWRLIPTRLKAFLLQRDGSR